MASTKRTSGPVIGGIAGHLALTGTLMILLAGACSKAEPSAAAPATAQTPTAAELENEAKAENMRAFNREVSRLLGLLEMNLRRSNRYDPAFQPLLRAFAAAGADADKRDDAILAEIGWTELRARYLSGPGEVSPAEQKRLQEQLGRELAHRVFRITALLTAMTQDRSDAEELADLDGQLNDRQDRGIAIENAQGTLQMFTSACKETFRELLPAIRAGVEQQQRRHWPWANRRIFWHGQFVQDLAVRAESRAGKRKVKCAPFVPWVIENPTPPG